MPDDGIDARGSSMAGSPPVPGESTGESMEGLGPTRAWAPSSGGAGGQRLSELPLPGDVTNFLVARFLNAELVSPEEYDSAPGVNIATGEIDMADLYDDSENAIYLTMESRNELQYIFNSNSTTIPPVGLTFESSTEMFKKVAQQIQKRAEAVEKVKGHVKTIARAGSADAKRERAIDSPQAKVEKEVMKRVIMSKMKNPFAPLNPFCTYRVYWTIFMFFINNMYVAIIVPIMTAWQIPFTPIGWATIVDLVCGAIYIVDIYVNLRTATLIAVSGGSTQKVVLSPKWAANHYIRRIDGMPLDVLCSLPFVFELLSQLVKMMDGEGLFSNQLPVLRIVRLLRLLKLLRMVKLSGSDSLGMEAVLRNSWMRIIPPIVIYIIGMVHVFFLLVNMFGCLWFWCANGMCGYEWEDTWVTQYSNDVTPDLLVAGKTRQYVVSLYWSMMTISTVGYGDIVAINNSEKTIAMITMFIGTLFFGLNCGKLASLLEQLETWMHKHRLPTQARRHIMQHCSSSWASSLQSGERDKSVLEMLPFGLRVDTIASIIEPALRDALGPLDMDLLKLLSQRIDILYVMPSQFVVVQGGPADAIFILQAGEMEMLEGGVAMHKLEEGDIFGTMKFLECTDLSCDHEGCIPSAVDVKAMTVCDLWELSEDKLGPVIRSFPALHMAFIKLVTDFEIQEEKQERWIESILNRKESALDRSRELSALPVKALNRRTSMLVTSRSAYGPSSSEVDDRIAMSRKDLLAQEGGGGAAETEGAPPEGGAVRTASPTREILDRPASARKPFLEAMRRRSVSLSHSSDGTHGAANGEEAAGAAAALGDKGGEEGIKGAVGGEIPEARTFPVDDFSDGEWDEGVEGGGEGARAAGSDVGEWEEGLKPVKIESAPDLRRSHSTSSTPTMARMAERVARETGSFRRDDEEDNGVTDGRRSATQVASMSPVPQTRSKSIMERGHPMAQTGKSTITSVVRAKLYATSSIGARRSEPAPRVATDAGQASPQTAALQFSMQAVLDQSTLLADVVAGLSEQLDSVRSEMREMRAEMKKDLGSQRTPNASSWSSAVGRFSSDDEGQPLTSLPSISGTRVALPTSSAEDRSSSSTALKKKGASPDSQVRLTSSSEGSALTLTGAQTRNKDIARGNTRPIPVRASTNIGPVFGEEAPGNSANNKKKGHKGGKLF